jgi:2-keto-4-pentenoate hydratase/2-oxohepta-3-ene-1,7-dioic acid hydratase in catechol pathway
VSKLARFIDPESGSRKTGLVEGDVVREIVGGLDEWAAGSFSVTNREHQLSSLRILPPVHPSKIVCVGRNYQAHAAELGNTMPDEPLLFLKPPSSVISHGETIRLPTVSARVEHEGELAVVIGRCASALPPAEDPLDYVLGYTCLNDVTARDLQKKDVQFTRAKSFDTFCPLGPYLVNGLDPSDLSVETRVNGLRKQFGRTSQMKFSVSLLVRYISHVMRLEPGDVIATGTPAGVGPIAEGDMIEVEVEGIGILQNYVSAAA